MTYQEALNTLKRCCLDNMCGTEEFFRKIYECVDTLQELIDINAMLDIALDIACAKLNEIYRSDPPFDCNDICDYQCERCWKEWIFSEVKKGENNEIR